MNDICTRKTTYSGFTLLELAIVLAIIGLLLTLLLPGLSAQRELVGRAETQISLNQIKEALIGYSVVNRHLPCPDNKAIPNGIEDRNSAGTCASDEGILPWATLGIESADAWNHYFRYRVDTTFSNNINLFTIANAENSSTIQIHFSPRGIHTANPFNTNRKVPSPISPKQTIHPPSGEFGINTTICSDLGILV